MAQERTWQYCQKPAPPPGSQTTGRGTLQLVILRGTVDSIFASTRFMLLYWANQQQRGSLSPFTARGRAHCGLSSSKQTDWSNLHDDSSSGLCKSLLSAWVNSGKIYSWHDFPLDDRRSYTVLEPLQWPRRSILDVTVWFHSQLPGLQLGSPPPPCSRDSAS